ncbi:MAG: hypothetical protein GY798_13790 [Hyphomicrobiales bacterium]|nr:hypothetical protein [Hyphomicrobiales bacterium]
MTRGLIAGVAAVLLTAGPAAAADPATIKDGCVNSTNWTEKACQCLADKAASLSAVQRDYVLAIVTNDDDGTAKAEEGLSVPQFAAVNTFIVNAGPECQGN